MVVKDFSSFILRHNLSISLTNIKQNYLSEKYGAQKCRLSKIEMKHRNQFYCSARQLS